jgi:hypothetical protein
MFKEITLDEAKGKKIRDYAMSCTCGQMIIVFTDKTFTTLGVDHGYQGYSDEIVQAKLDLLDFDNAALIALEVVVLQEIESAERIKEREFIQQDERRERAEYKRLKAKYEERK